MNKVYQISAINRLTTTLLNLITIFWYTYVTQEHGRKIYDDKAGGKNTWGNSPHPA